MDNRFVLETAPEGVIAIYNDGNTEILDLSTIEDLRFLNISIWNSHICEDIMLYNNLLSSGMERAVIGNRIIAHDITFSTFREYINVDNNNEIIIDPLSYSVLVECTFAQENEITAKAGFVKYQILCFYYNIQTYGQKTHKVHLKTGYFHDMKLESCMGTFTGDDMEYGYMYDAEVYLSPVDIAWHMKEGGSFRCRAESAVFETANSLEDILNAVCQCDIYIERFHIIHECVDMHILARIAKECRASRVFVRSVDCMTGIMDFWSYIYNYSEEFEAVIVVEQCACIKELLGGFTRTLRQYCHNEYNFKAVLEVSGNMDFGQAEYAWKGMRIYTKDNKIGVLERKP